MTMVRRVAEAMEKHLASEGISCAWLPELLARVAIEAMQKPTPAMVQAAYAGSEAPIVSSEIQEAWITMISVALAEDN